MSTSHLDQPPAIRPDDGQEQCGFWRSRAGLVAIGFLLLGAFVVLSEHWLHVLGYLPFLLLLLCPLLHLFMHGGHGHGAHGGSGRHEKSRDLPEGN